MCVLDKAMSMTGWVRLLPPAQGVLALEEHYPSLGVSTLSDLSLTLHRPLKVVGRVVAENNPLAGQDAKIIAVAQGAIPDLQIHQDATANSSASYDYEKGYTDKPGFELYVNEERSYDIFVYSAPSDGAEVPPYHVRRSFTRDLKSADPDVYSWDIVLPSPEQYLHIFGCVRSMGKVEKPLAGAKVTAVSKDSGKTSTPGLTDADGCFDLAVQPPDEFAPEVFSVRLKSTPENELVPEMEIAAGEVSQDLDIGEVLVPGIDELVPVTVVVTATMPAPQEGSPGYDPQANAPFDSPLAALTEEVVGTVVSLATNLGEGTLRVERTVASVDGQLDEAAGEVTVTALITIDLPPANYALSIVPRGESRFGLYQQVLVVYPGSNAPTPFVHALKEKAVTRILVEDPSGQPVTGGRILAVLSGKGDYPDVAPLPTRKYQAAEDVDEPGTYIMSLDPGLYTLQVDPQEGSGLPRLVEHNMHVKGQSQQRLVTIAQPVAVAGKIVGTVLPRTDAAAGGAQDSPTGDQPRGPYDGPVSGVKIELYDELEGLGTPDGVAPIPIATGWTDQDGKFVLLLPAE